MLLQECVLELHFRPDFKLQAFAAQVVVLDRQHNLFLLGEINSCRNLLDLLKRRCILLFQVLILLFNLRKVGCPVVVQHVLPQMRQRIDYDVHSDAEMERATMCPKCTVILTIYMFVSTANSVR